jgi:hypothetical protein
MNFVPRLILVWVMTLVFLTSFAFAEVPQIINYQGRLTNASGNPVADGSYLMKFKIYGSADGDDSLWYSGYQSVTVTDGLFTYQLGSAVQLHDDLFADTLRWLGITVGTDPEITPRTRLVSVAYSYRVSTVDGASGGTISGDVSIQSDLTVSGKATIGPGHANTGAYAFVAGENNEASGAHSTIGGGMGNTASGDTSTVSGGAFNTASGSAGASTVCGGVFNSAEGNYSTVGGGMLDTASGSSSTVGGGSHNVASDLGCTIGGGIANFAGSGQGSTVGGGRNNTATGLDATIAGGKYSMTSNSYAVVGGGYSDTASGYASVVAGGRSNVASGDESTVGGGLFNTASGLESVAAGGRSNTASGDSSTVSGGAYNNATNDGSTVGGGISNSSEAMWSTVGGGNENTASGNYSTVAGGWNNTTSYTGCTVGGGYSNTASQATSTVAGGIANTASGDGSTVAGGSSNTATGMKSAVGGGLYNYVSGDYACIPGGERDTVIGDNSMAFGKGVYVSGASYVVFFDGSVSGRVSINRDGRDGLSLLPIRVGTSTSNGNGAYLTTGGTWTNGSSRTVKEHFQELDGKDVLDRIDRLPVESWEYKGTGERHIWPCAEDFHEQFDVGVIKEDGTRDKKYLAAGDIAGVALIGVKQLSEENDKLRQRIEELETIVRNLMIGQNSQKADDILSYGI